MDFRILGPLEVRDGERFVRLPRKKHRALLALLLLRAGEPISTDVLVEELWGSNPPRTAREALHNYVSQLRRELGAEVLQTRDQAYVLAVEPEQVDALRFQRLVAGARAAQSADERVAALREALGLWRGPSLEELAYEPFAAAEIGRLEELRLASREDLFDAELEVGGGAELVPELEARVAERPFRERLRGQLMLALYRAGRQADALQAYRDARGVLLDELGLEPSAALRELEQAILRQDPGLEPPGVLPSVEERRKTVTILFAELPSDVGLDPERMRERAVRARAVIELHGGSVEARGGDELLGVFGVPQSHEDDALRALRAASELDDIRVGVDTGEALVGHGFVSGEVVSRAARLQRAAVPGEVRFGEATLALCSAAVAAEPVDSGFRLVDVVEGAAGVARALDTPLVGRERELAALEAAYVETRDARRCGLVVLVGEPGIGKTRLARELIASLGDDRTVLVGRCASYGAGATWRPLAEMLDQAGEQLEPILAAAGSPGEVFLAARRLFERLAAEKPLVLALDDLHWAEPTLLDFVDYLAARAEGPVLCLCLTRPKLLAERPALAVGAIELGPLPDEQAAMLAAGVEPDVRARLVETAGGNPLFLEQLVAFAGEGGDLGAVPSSVEALIAARLDQLEAAERALLERAAAVGRLFSRAAVQELGADVALLPALQEKGFVRRLRSGYRFHHVLVREVAYASIPRLARSDLHERLADWLDERGELDELVGYHLEQACRDREAIGLSDGKARRLAADAGRRLGAAGTEAWKRGEVPATINLLGRAAALLPERDRYRLELLCELGPALRTGGDFGQAKRMLREAIKLPAERRVELRARMELAGVQIASDRARTAEELLDIATEAIRVFEAVGDDRSLGRAWRWIAHVHGDIHGRYTASADAAERAIAHLRRSGWPTAVALGDLASAYRNGPTPVPEAIHLCRRLLRAADLAGRARILGNLAVLEAMRERLGPARRLIAETRDLYEQLGQRSNELAICGSLEATIELLAGDVDAAETALRESCTALEQMGDQANLATRAAQLAEILLLQGSDEEAGQWISLAEELGAEDDVWTQIRWRTVRAKLLARQGELARAEGLARTVRQLADTTDALEPQAKALISLAEALHLAGQDDQSQQLYDEAVRLLLKKGNLAAAKQARGVMVT
jgi:DNA-binding SARP family transcriptional activator